MCVCIRIHFGGIEREESDQSCCCTDRFMNKIKIALEVISRMDVGLLSSNLNQDISCAYCLVRGLIIFVFIHLNSVFVFY